MASLIRICGLIAAVVDIVTGSPTSDEELSVALEAMVPGEQTECLFAFVMDFNLRILSLGLLYLWGKLMDTRELTSSPTMKFRSVQAYLAHKPAAEFEFACRAKGVGVPIA